MKYMVKWTENHNYLVEAESEDEAVGVAQAEDPGDTFYDFGRPTAEMIPDPEPRYFEVTWRNISSKQVMAKDKNEALSKAILDACQNPGGVTRTFDDKFVIQVEEIHKNPPPAKEEQS